MYKKNTKNTIIDLKRELGLSKGKRSMMMESILCDDEAYDFADDNYDDVKPEANRVPCEGKYCDVEGAINQIRQIALNVISKLAADPTDEKYIFMKKIWQLCDKTIEDKINAVKYGDEKKEY